MRLLRSVIEAYRVDSGNDWRFCLLVAFILSEIAMKNATKGNNNNNNNNDNDNNSLAVDIPLLFHCFQVELGF